MAYLNGNKILFGAPMTVIDGGGSAESYDDGYKDGQIALLKDSKYMKGEVQAINAISINDCSYIEQELDVKITSLNSTDNLLIEPKLIYSKEENNVYFEETGTSIRLMGISWPTPPSPTVRIGLPDNLIDGVTYYTGLIYVRGNAEAHPIEIGFHCWNDDNSGQSFYLVPQVVWNSSYYDYDNRHLTLMPSSNIDYDMVEIIPVISTAPIGSDPIDLSTVKVSRYGRNLLKWEAPQMAYTTTTYYIDTYLHKGTYTFNSNFHKIIDDTVKYGVFLGEGTSLNYQTAKVIIRNFSGTSFKDSFTIETSGNYRLFFRITGTTTIDQLGEYLTADDKMAQISVGNSILPIEQYVEPIEYGSTTDGTVKGIEILPNMTLITDNENVLINCQYYRDIDTYIDNLMMNVALTGGV